MEDDRLIEGTGNASAEDGTWTRRDVWMGVFFLFKSALLAALLVAFHRKGIPLFVCLPAGFLCVLFLFLGVNATIRSLTSGR